MLITVPRAFEDDVMNFVRGNEIKEINAFLFKCLRDGFNIAKYGYSPQDNFNKENKPFKLEKYETDEEKGNAEGLEGRETKKRRGRPKKEHLSASEKDIKHEEKTEEVVKPKKKITIIKK